MKGKRIPSMRALRMRLRCFFDYLWYIPGMAPVSNNLSKMSPRRTDVRRGLVTPLAYHRPRYPLPSCTSAELDSNGVDLKRLSRRRVSPRHANCDECRDVRLGETDLRAISPRHWSLGPFFPACAIYRLPSKIAKIIWTQEPMPKKIPVLNLLPPTLGQQYADGID